MTVFGQTLQDARRQVAVFVNTVTPNVTTTLYAFAVPVGMGKVRVEKVSWVSTAALSDADGTILANVLARDASEGADDTLVSSQSIEAGTAHALADFTLATEGAEKEFTLDEGDSVRVTIVSNSAAIDTNGAVGIFITYYPIPQYGAEQSQRVQHPSTYSA